MEQYDEMTPHELGLLATVIGEKNTAEFEKEVTLAWMGEMYHRQEKLPPLQECLDDLKPKEPEKPMSDDSMIQMAHNLNAMFGGEVITHEKVEEEKDLEQKVR